MLEPGQLSCKATTSSYLWEQSEVFRSILPAGEGGDDNASFSPKARVWMPATVHGKTPDYGRLAPAIADSLARPRLVPLYAWAPSTQGGVGAMKPLSAYELYQLHGAHLLVATLRVRAQSLHSVSVWAEITYKYNMSSN